MYNIAICDSTAKELLSIMSQLDSYLEERRPEAETATDVFSKPQDLLEGFMDKKYDLLILDMKTDGIQTAREARRFNPAADVIFLADSAEKAIDAFSVNALGYLLKPVKKEQFESAMNRAFRKIPERRPEGIAIKNLSGNLMSVDIKDILYVESREKIIRIVQRETDDILARSSLSATFEHLGKFKHIVKCGSSYIINLDGVKKIDDKSVIMSNGTAIPIPRRAVNEVRERYAAYSQG